LFRSSAQFVPTGMRQHLHIVGHLFGKICLIALQLLAVSAKNSKSPNCDRTMQSPNISKFIGISASIESPQRDRRWANGAGSSALRRSLLSRTATRSPTTCDSIKRSKKHHFEFCAVGTFRAKTRPLRKHSEPSYCVGVSEGRRCRHERGRSGGLSGCTSRTLPVHE